MSAAIDVLVIGAGPSGALAARQGALGGARTLLVDRAAFPREKVCGCCLNGRALATLDAAGLGGRMRGLPGHALRQIELHAGGRRATLNLPGGVAVSRAALDQMLVEAAIDAGATFRPRTTAEVLPGGRVRLRDRDEAATLEAGCVVVADGLGGRSLRTHDGFVSRAAPASHVGLGAILERDGAVEPGTIRMVCGRRGYVGMVRLGDGRLDVAAAVAPVLVREAGGPAAAVKRVFDEAGVGLPAGLRDARWTGTPALTCQRTPLWAERTLVVGDAAGYVEPFTGEGIAWALAGGAAVAGYAQQASEAWDPAIGQAWQATHRRLVRRRQARCRAIAAVLRRPRLLRTLIGVVSMLPGVAGPIVNGINRPRTAHREAVPG
jgi:flavin-dependent dehydrogenase